MKIKIYDTIREEFIKLKSLFLNPVLVINSFKDL